MVCLYSCFVKNRIKLRVRVSRLGFCLLLCLCGLACSFVVAVRSISSVRLLCLALLLRGLVRLLFYCGLLCCSGLFSVAVVLVVVQLVCLLCLVLLLRLVLCCCCACVV